MDSIRVYPDCANQCEAVFEPQREVDELKAERDNWARAAEVRQEYYSAAFLVYTSPDHGPDEIALVAAAYAIAELGDDWRSELKG
jgi:hypothetical protein